MCRTVTLLNKYGLPTLGSCQGHYEKEKGWTKTFVSYKIRSQAKDKKLMEETEDMRKNHEIEVSRPMKIERTKGRLILFLTHRKSERRNRILQHFNEHLKELKR